MAAGTITTDWSSLDNQINGLRIRRNEIKDFEGWRQGMHSTSETSDGLWKKVFVHQNSVGGHQNTKTTQTRVV